MKRNASLWAIALIVAASPFASTVRSDDGSAFDARQRATIGRAAYASAEEPATKVVAPDKAESAAMGQSVSLCAGDCESADRCAPDKPWSIPQPCLLQKMGVKMGGWVQQGITTNNHGRGDGFNGPIGTDDFNGEYQMNQAWLFFDRPANNEGCGWAWGGHVDMMYGTDWRFGINHGLEDRINAFDRQSYGLVLPQMYLELAYDNLSVKLGHMDDVMGYETVPAVLNPLYSHSYAMAFSEPLLVTGVLADYKLTERFSLQAGFHRGWMQFEDYNTDLDFFGGFKWQSCSKKTSLAYALSTGPQDPQGQQDRFVYSLVLQQALSERTQYVLQHNLGVQRHSTLDNGDATWYGLNQYLLYTMNPCWKLVGRFEWFRDNNGARVFGPPPEAGIRAWPGAPGFAGNFYETTVGVNWRPNSNLAFRPEVRWDWYEGTRNVRNQLPFNSGQNSSQFLFAVDAIVTF